MLIDSRPHPWVDILPRVLATARATGITRVADITHLDHLGIPVVSVARPNARSLSIASGTGTTIVQATISAIMESLELYHAEHFAEAVPLHRLTPDITWREPLNLIYRQAGKNAPSELKDDCPMAIGTDLQSGAPMALPAWLVHADCRSAVSGAPGGFAISSNGLCGGNTMGAATLHGLCELIERDALAQRIAHEGIDAVADLDPIDGATIEDDELRALIARCAERGVDTYLFDITAPTGVPVFYCRLIERRANPSPLLVATDGTGCSPDAAIAMRRAFLEAVQTRLLFIAGARDDIRSRAYRVVANRPASTRRATFTPSRGDPGIGSQIGWILQRLKAEGYPYAISFDLDNKIEGVCFLRLVVPGLGAAGRAP